MTNLAHAKEAPEASVDRLIERLNAIYQSGDNIPDEALQQLLTVCVKLYIRKHDDEHVIPPFIGESITPTDVVKTVCEMLDYVDLQLFELGMWKASRGANRHFVEG